MADAPSFAVPDISKLDFKSWIPKDLFGLSWLAVFDIVVGLIILVGLIWYFTRRGKLKYNIQIYERDASGIPIPVDTDILTEKIINKGKNTLYMLRKYNCPAHPPIFKFIYKRKKSFFGDELWCDYLRERQDFIPVQRLVQFGVTTTDDMAEFTRRLVEVYQSKPDEVRDKYIYSPLIPLAIARLKYEPMDYNMAEMMQVRLAQREMLYSDKQGFMQTYGPVIGIGLAAVCIIVVAVLAFQFASNSIQTSTGAANAVADKIGGVIAAIENRPLNGGI